MSRSQPSHIPPAMSRRVARLSWWLAAVLAIAGGAMGTAAGRQLSRVTRFAPPAVAAQQVRTDEEALLASEPKDRARVRFTRYDAKKGAQGPSDREGDLPARFLRALDALRSSQFRLAAGEFAALTEEYPALANRARFFGARAHIGLDRPLSAAALLESVQKDASIYADARLLLAQLHRKGERPQEAEGILRALLGHPPLKDRPALRAQALWQLAEVQRGRGDTAAERGTMLSLWSEHPDSPWASRAAGLLPKPVPLGARIRRAEALVEMGKVPEGLAALPAAFKLGPLPQGHTCRARTVAAKAYRRQRQYARAIGLLKPVVRQCTDAALLPDALFALADAQSIAEPLSAVATADTLARRFPAHPLADDALFLGAQMLKHTDRAGAAQRLSAVSERYGDSNAAPEALFQLFLSHRRQGEVAPALAALEGVLTRVPAGELRQRARYWRARTLETLRPLEAELELERLGEEHAGTFHGLLSRGRLSELNPDRALALARRLAARADSAEPSVGPADELEFNAHVAAGAELLRLGLPGASAELSAGVEKLPELEQSHLVQLMAEAEPSGELRHLVFSLSRASGLGTLTRATQPLWKTAYPTAYRELIESSAERVGIEPLLFRALVRTESQFRPKARSPVGAMGLAQVMMPTAREVAAKHGLGEITEERLLEPDQNLQIGALYMRGLLRQFKNEPILAVAAYNAGPGAVRRWLRGGRFAGQWDAWAEDIPITETRLYVKHVLGGYAAYRLLDKPQEPAVWASRR